MFAEKDCPNNEVHRSCLLYEEYVCYRDPSEKERSGTCVSKWVLYSGVFLSRPKVEAPVQNNSGNDFRIKAKIKISPLAMKIPPVRATTPTKTITEFTDIITLSLHCSTTTPNEKSELSDEFPDVDQDRELTLSSVEL
ncbi:hypothetical protein ACJJTC_019549 [Scirpophaga incertulas]